MNNLVGNIELNQCMIYLHSEHRATEARTSRAFAFGGHMFVPIWVLTILVLLAILGATACWTLHMLSECMPDQRKTK